MLPILFQDDRFVVLDKPHGLAVHPGPRGGPSVEDLFPQLSRRRTGPWLAHRLDADTAGCLVVALKRAALLEAQALFAAGRARKTYWAIVRGTPAARQGVMTAGLSKRNGPAGWRMITDPSGQHAETLWRSLASNEGHTLLELTPRTGRTHQIRVHCATLGCPILGDTLYGNTARLGPQTTLHLLARAIGLDLEPPLAAIAEPHEAMARWIMAAGFKPEPEPAVWP